MRSRRWYRKQRYQRRHVFSCSSHPSYCQSILQHNSFNNEVEDDYWIRNQFSDDDDDDTDDTDNYSQSNYRPQSVLEPPLPPLKYLPSDNVLVVQVWATRGIYQDEDDNYTVLVLSETIDGGSIPNFFFNGNCSVTLPYPRTPIVRTFFWRYRVSYRLLRKPDTKVILSMETNLFGVRSDLQRHERCSSRWW